MEKQINTDTVWWHEGQFIRQDGSQLTVVAGQYRIADGVVIQVWKSGLGLWVYQIDKEPYRLIDDWFLDHYEKWEIIG